MTKCPECGYPLGRLIANHPDGVTQAVALMAMLSTPCCGYIPTTEECKAWIRAHLPR